MAGYPFNGFVPKNVCRDVADACDLLDGIAVSFFKAGRGWDDWFLAAIRVCWLASSSLKLTQIHLHRLYVCSPVLVVRQSCPTWKDGWALCLLVHWAFGKWTAYIFLRVEQCFDSYRLEAALIVPPVVIMFITKAAIGEHGSLSDSLWMFGGMFLSGSGFF